MLAGHDLSRLLYGQTDERFVKAVRQLMREVRLKLPSYYDEHPTAPVQFRLQPNDYRLRIVTSEDSHRSRSPWRMNARRWRTRAVFAASLLAALAIMPMGARLVGPPVRASRIEATPEGFRVLTASGSRLPAVERRLRLAIGFRVPAGGISRSEALRCLTLAGPAGTRLVVAAFHPGTPGRTLLAWFDEKGQQVGRLPLPSFPDRAGPPRFLHSRDGRDVYEVSFKILSLEPAELDGDGRADEVVLSVAQREGHPCQVLGLDVDGPPRVLLDYWHTGQARATVVPDRDGNGADEVVVIGQNNDHLNALAVVLSPVPGKILRGRTPDGWRGKTLRETRAYEVVGRSYRFPRTLLSRSPLLQRVLRDSVTEARWDPERSEWEFLVLDASQDPMGTRRPRISYRIDELSGTVRARILDEDLVVRLFGQLARMGEIEDRWHVVDGLRLDAYEDHLAQGVEIHDARTPRLGWHAPQIDRMLRARGGEKQGPAGTPM